MQELIATFHIDWKLMIAQIVNFGLVFAALYYIAAKPLSKLMKERGDEIEGGLENAVAAKLAVENANLKKDEIIREAKASANETMKKGELSGKEIVQNAKKDAEAEKEKIMMQAKADAEKEKKKVEDAVRKEAAAIVAEGVQRIIGGYVAEGHGEKIIKAMLEKKTQ
ncbi:MAG TPA: F0F1 ATP synthase subunit B [Candidatus Paceibacterota bacterium]